MIGGFRHSGDEVVGKKGFPNPYEGYNLDFVSYGFLNRDCDSEVWPRLVYRGSHRRHQLQ